MTAASEPASDTRAFASESALDRTVLTGRPAGSAPDVRRAIGVALVALIALAGLAAWWWRSAPAAPDTGVANSQRPAATDASPPPAAAPIVDGTLSVETRPAGAEVLVDGVPRGMAPLELTLPAGSYVVELRNGGATRRLDVAIEAGAVVRQIVDLAPAAPGPGGRSGAASAATSQAPPSVEGGWVAFSSPIELQIFEDGRRLGSTRTSRLLLAAGPHELELVSDAFEFRTTVTSVVAEGRVLTLPIAMPTGRLFINAVPWADVWIDDRPLGSTPLANVEVPVGDHQVVWRHPELGDRRQTVRVGAETPVRLGMDMTRPGVRSTP